MTAQIIVLSDVRALKRKRAAGGAVEAVGELISLQAALTALTLETLATAARIATTPMWPGGIDDLWP